jgi:hypothetical protein
MNVRLLREFLKGFLLELDMRTVQNALSERGDLPFEELFKGNLRVALPFVSDTMKDIKDILEDDYGYEVDIDNKKAYKVVETRKGPQKTVGRLGKVLAKIERELSKKFKSMLSPEQEAAVVEAIEMHGRRHAPFFLYNKERRRWWRRRTGEGIYEVITDEIARTMMVLYTIQDLYDDYSREGSGYAIIISRAPIDLLRMSDYKNLKSCHSKGGSYWKCAIQEAQNGGAIAYMVNKNDFESIDLNQPEIFEDKERSIEGIKPISRLRIRNFVIDYGDEEYDLAVPEERTYGLDVGGFEDKVLEWSRENQISDFYDDNGEVELPPQSQIKIRGGTYSDTAGGSLLNNFFETKAYSGHVEYENEEAVSIEEQYEQEAQQYYDTLAEDISNVWIDWEVGGLEDEPFIRWTGGISLENPDDEEYFKMTRKELEKALDIVNQASNGVVDLDFYIASTIEEGAMVTGYSFDITPDGNSIGHPDDFASFLRYCQDIDKAMPAMQEAWEKAYWQLKEEEKEERRKEQEALDM